MQILQHQQQWSARGEPAEQAAQPREQQRPPHFGRPLAWQPLSGQLSQHPRQLYPLPAESGRFVIAWQGLQRLDQRRVRQGASGQRRRTAHRDQRPRPPGLLGELADQPALAHPRLTGDQQQPRPASRCPPQRAVQIRQLLVPPHEQPGWRRPRDRIYCTHRRSSQPAALTALTRPQGPGIIALHARPFPASAKEATGHN